jgi:hypothetical protein
MLTVSGDVSSLTLGKVGLSPVVDIGEKINVLWGRPC